MVRFIIPESGSVHEIKCDNGIRARNLGWDPPGRNAFAPVGSLWGGVGNLNRIRGEEASKSSPLATAALLSYDAISHRFSPAGGGGGYVIP